MDRESMENEDEFEFASTETDPSVTADEIFSNGQIRPVYPVFNRDLLLDDVVGVGGGGGEEKFIGVPLRSLLAENRIRAPLTRSASISSSSSTDDLEGGVQSGTYCAWAPKSTPASPDRCKKSRSTGSSRRWRLMDLVLGRSPSDGKEKLVYMVHPKKEDDSRLHPSRDLKMKPPPPQHPAATATAAKGEVKKEKGVRVKGSEMDMETAHRIYYGKSGGGQAAEGGRRSFLPYNVGLGLFAGSSNLGRTRHPFG